MPEQAPTPTGRRARPGGRTARTRSQVLEATVRLIAEHGAEHLHYDEIARNAGVNRTTVHRNWPNRDELVMEALTGFARTAITLPDSEDITADLTEFVYSLAQTARTTLGRALMRALIANESSPVREAGLRLLDERLPELQARIDRAARKGDLPPVDATLLNELLTGPVQLRMMRRRDPFELADARRIVEIVLTGLRNAPGPPGEPGTPPDHVPEGPRPPESTADGGEAVSRNSTTL